MFRYLQSYYPLPTPIKFVYSKQTSVMLRLTDLYGTINLLKYIYKEQRKQNQVYEIQYSSHKQKYCPESEKQQLFLSCSCIVLLFLHNGVSYDL